MELLIYAWLAGRSDHLNLQSACELGRGRGRGRVLEDEALHLWEGPLSPGGVSPTELHRNIPSQCWRIAQWNGNPPPTHAPIGIGTGTSTWVGVNLRGVILHVLLFSRGRQKDRVPRFSFLVILKQSIRPNLSESLLLIRKTSDDEQRG